MVTHSGTQYYDDDEPTFHRRYTGRGHAFPISHDRDLGSRSTHRPYGHRLSHDSRNIQTAEQEQPSSNPRRRIPVACGRCRKRKIRCSGDPGNGGPCSNCKAAGNASCQFLRVSSQEAPLKGETTEFTFEPPSGLARLQQMQMLSYRPQFAQAPPLNLDGYANYRHGSMPGFQYPVKQYYSSSFNDYQDENDYGLQQSSYQILPQEQTALSSPIYNTAAYSRQWAPTQQISRNTALYLEEDSPSYTHASYTTPSYSLPVASRTISNDSNKHSISLTGMASSLPIPTPVPERVLPYPAVARQVLRSSESMSALQSPPPRNLEHYASCDGLLTQSHYQESKTTSNGSVADNTSIPSSYLPLVSSTAESLPSSQLDINSQSFGSVSSQQQQQHSPQDLFTPQSGNSLGSYGIASSIHGSSEDLRYAHSSSIPKRGSFGHGIDRNNSLSEDLTSRLSNDEYYRPPPATGYFPPPTMMSGPHNSSPESHRRSSVVPAS